MKKILVTVVLGVAAVAAAQDAAKPAQPPQGQAVPAQPSATSTQAPAAAPAQAPVIKDPAEYNAYVGAIQQKDPAAQISGLEAFMTQYPNSVMKVAALQTLMQDYQQTNNQQKTIDTAMKLVTADTCNVRALALLAFFDRLKAQGGDANAKLAQQPIPAQGKRHQDFCCDQRSADCDRPPVLLGQPMCRRQKGRYEADRIDDQQQRHEG